MSVAIRIGVVLLALTWAGGGFANSENTASETRSTERFVVISNGEVVGGLQTRRRGSHLQVDYHVEDNGRGPRTHEEIDLSANGLPRRWRIAGSGESGAAIRESFDWNASKASWLTLNDRGSVAATATQRSLYLAQGASPYAYAVYIEALLATHDSTLECWPAGSIRAERLTVAEKRPAIVGSSARVWALWGLEVDPIYVVVDSDGKFRAWLSTDRLVIPEGWLSDSNDLAHFAVALDRSLLRKFTDKIVHRWDVPVYLRNVRVFDPVSRSLSADQTVVVFRGRISGVVPSDIPLPAAAVAFDGEGGTVMAALFDMHAHISAWQAPLYLAAGVLTVRDMGNDNAALLDLMSEFQSARIAGPSVVPSGFLEGRSAFSARDGFIVDGLPAALESVRWYADHGYWQLKLYNSIDPDWVAPLATEAHHLGMRVAGHVPAFMTSQRAIRDGYDEITHLNQLLLSLMIDSAHEDTRTPFRFTALGERTGSLDLQGAGFQQLVKLMQAHNTALDPTVAILSKMLLGRPGEVTPADAPWIDHVPGPVQRNRKAAMLNVPASMDGRYRASEMRLLEALKALYAAGIRILPGTDDAPGFMLQSELETWQRAGIAPIDVLTLATLGCASYLGLDQELGSVTRGKRADLLLLAGDPTRDVGELRKNTARHEGRSGVLPRRNIYGDANSAVRGRAADIAVGRLPGTHFRLSGGPPSRRRA